MSNQPGLFEEPKFPTPAEGELNALRLRVPKLEANLLAILKCTAEEVRACKECKTELFFVKTTTGARVPFSRDGTNHFVECPNPGRFSRKGKG